MKNIKEYINEGLFDDEDDLLDKKPDQAIIYWFENNIDNPQWYISNRMIWAKNGIVYRNIPGDGVMIFNSNPPDWIKFDKKNWPRQYSQINFDVKSQDDINNIPGRIIWVYSKVFENVEVNTGLNITFFNPVEIKNVKLYNKTNDSIEVRLSRANPSKDTLMNISSVFNEINLDIWNTKLYRNFKAQIKRLGINDFYDKNKEMFLTLYKNNVKELLFGDWGYITILKDAIQLNK